MPGVSGNHLLSIFGDSGNAAGSKLMADPGPQRSGPVGVGEAVGDGVSDAAVGIVEPVVPGDDGAGAAFCPEHETTVDAATNRMRAEPSIVRRSCGWDISVAFAFGIPGHPEARLRHQPPTGSAFRLTLTDRAQRSGTTVPARRGFRSLGAIHRGKIAPSPCLRPLPIPNLLSRNDGPVPAI
jgi:hypothetical protein